MLSPSSSHASIMSSPPKTKKSKLLTPKLTVTIEDSTPEDDLVQGTSTSLALSAPPRSSLIARLKVPTPCLLPHAQDETPTPIRILREVEESGIFGDLNPFDATFRRAVQGQDLPRKDTPSIAEDSLNTPQIYPIPESVIVSVPVSSASSSLNIIPQQQQPQQQLQPQQVQQPSPSSASQQFRPIAPSPGKAPVKPVPEAQLLIRLPGGESVHLSTLPVIKEKAQEPQHQQQPGSSKLDLKRKLKDTILASSSSGNVYIGDNKSSPENRQPAKRGRELEDDILSKRNELLERNRAAAQRSRSKRKQEASEAKAKMDRLASANRSLSLENDLLRHEITKLKSILRHHLDCPVARSMEQTDLIGREMLPKLVAYKVCDAEGKEMRAVPSVQPGASVSTDILEKATKEIAVTPSAENASSSFGLKKETTSTSPPTEKTSVMSDGELRSRTEGMMSVKHKIKSHFTEYQNASS